VLCAQTRYVCAQFGEARIQFHVVTDGHDQMEPQIKAFLDTMNAYGHRGVELFWTDNPSGDYLFFTRLIPTLVDTQRTLDGLAPPPPPHAVPACDAGADRYNLATQDTEIESKVFAARNFVARLPPEQRVMSLDAEWDTTKNKRGSVTGTGKVAVIQLSFRTQADGEVHALVLHVHSKKTLPQAMLDLFSDKGICFTGRNIGGDLKRIGKDFGCLPLMNGMHVVKLGRMARTRDVVRSGTAGLDVLVLEILKQRLLKSPAVRLSNWSSKALSDDQVKYAALDVIKALEVYFKLAPMPNLTARLVQADISTGKAVDIVPAHGSVELLATRAATGVILPQPTPHWEMPSIFQVSKSVPKGPMCLVSGKSAPHAPYIFGLIIPHFDTDCAEIPHFTHYFYIY